MIADRTQPTSLKRPGGSPASGFAAATAAFVLWGVFPLYLSGLMHVSAVQITAHRILWSCIFVLAWMGMRGELTTLRAVAAQRRLLALLAASALLMTINWLAYAWAVTNGQVVEVSLGYYINPLANVLLGVFVLSERLTRLQWTAVTLAAAGVTYLTIETGYVPWIALVVATSFALYGLIRKTAHIEALPGLAVEMMMLMPLAVGYLLWCEMKGLGSLAHSGAVVDTLLVLIGPATAIPLFLFSYGARRIPYSTVGLLLYVGPTLQLVCAVLFFRESFDRVRVIGFAFIWMALLVYAADGLWRAAGTRTRTAA